jgi:hypothetical protein
MSYWDVATSGTHQTSIAGDLDAFVLKYDAWGAIIWGTYYGGPSNDMGYQVKTDALGKILVSGVTLSTTGIASVGAHQTSKGG